MSKADRNSKTASLKYCLNCCRIHHNLKMAHLKKSRRTRSLRTLRIFYFERLWSKAGWSVWTRKGIKSKNKNESTESNLINFCRFCCWKCSLVSNPVASKYSTKRRVTSILPGWKPLQQTFLLFCKYLLIYPSIVRRTYRFQPLLGLFLPPISSWKPLSFNYIVRKLCQTCI